MPYANHSGFHRLCRSLGIAAGKPGFIDVLKDCQLAFFIIQSLPQLEHAFWIWHYNATTPTQ